MSLKQYYKPLPDIGLIGKMRSGKDEVYKALEQMGFHVERLAFGDAMKAKFYDIFPDKPRDPKPVKDMQTFNVMREIDSDVWVKPTIDKRDASIADHKYVLQQMPPSFIYTDIRQPNEYRAVKSTGAIMVKVVAPEEQRINRMVKAGEVVTNDMLVATTELAMDDFEFDYKIDNSGDILDLQKEITQMVYEIQNREVH